MSKKIYTGQEIEILERNPNIKSVFSKSITYSPAFKIKAVEQNKNGMTATVIFEEAGLPESLVGVGKAHQSLGRWKKSLAKQGQDDLLQETL